LEDTGVDGRIMLKYFKIWDLEVVEWIDVILDKGG